MHYLPNLQKKVKSNKIFNYMQETTTWLAVGMFFLKPLYI